jgi:transcriptional regulator with XRE-family HTH domain
MDSSDLQGMLRASLAEQIRLLRRTRGLSQEVLGFRCSLHRTYISLVERSQKSLTVDALARIAAALGTKPSELLARAEAVAFRGRDNQRESRPGRRSLI